MVERAAFEPMPQIRPLNSFVFPPDDATAVAAVASSGLWILRNGAVFVKQ